MVVAETGGTAVSGFSNYALTQSSSILFSISLATSLSK